MNKWDVKFLDEFRKDLRKIDGSLHKVIFKGIEKVRENPLPASEGGYGKPLGSKNSTNLTNMLKIKYRGIGIRIVYTLVREEKVMNLVTISSRSDEECYKIADNRKKLYGDNLFKDVFKGFSKK